MMTTKPRLQLLQHAARQRYNSLKEHWFCRFMYYITRELSVCCILFSKAKVHCARLKTRCIHTCWHYHFRSLHWACDQNCLKTHNNGNAHQLSCLRAGACMRIQYSMPIIVCVLRQKTMVHLLVGPMTTISCCSRCAFVPVHSSLAPLTARRTVACEAASATFVHSQPLYLNYA